MALPGLATSDAAVAEIYAVKGRPTFNPLISHFAAAEAAAREARLDAGAERLAARFWPGPLTLVAPVAADCRISLLARAGLDTLASARARRRGRAGADRGDGRAAGGAFGQPLRRRQPDVAREHVLADLGGRIELILDGGPCEWGVESTVVACLGGAPRLLRPGAISREEIEAALGARLAEAPDGPAPIAPGALASHYAPSAPAAARCAGCAAEARRRWISAAALGAGLDLSPDGDLRQAAANLFAHLRALDATGAEVIFVAPIPETRPGRGHQRPAASRRRAASCAGG